MIDIIVFCHKHILPCTFVLMALCIYERSLFPMHSYLCGRNLDICVIILNRSSNLPWMISQWFCWSWDMHKLMPIYLLTLLFYCLLCQKSKNIQEVENSKSLIDIIVFCHKHFLPCTFVPMALCIYKRNLFPMHSYHCGRNLDICVIVVNRFSNLLWMICQWFFWSWDMHRLVLIYFPTLLFSYFA